MSNWTYSEHDGKHIINDERGVLIAMVCDAQTSELVVRLHKELPEKDHIIDELRKVLDEAETETKKLYGKYESKKNLLKLTADSRDEWKKMYDDACDSAHKLQLALEEVKEALCWGDLQKSVDKADEIINKAFGESNR
ncbi:hypothetical protein [Paenibacillus sp. NRS-1780]|uniref:hypothetical protein n=1 Tax=Paenibacillus sp. NRS-1780 TaxID=3233904 RepID=UPI003D277A1A